MKIVNFNYVTSVFDLSKMQSCELYNQYRNPNACPCGTLSSTHVFHLVISFYRCSRLSSLPPILITFLVKEYRTKANTKSPNKLTTHTTTMNHSNLLLNYTLLYLTSNALINSLYKSTNCFKTFKYAGV